MLLYLIKDPNAAEVVVHVIVHRLVQCVAFEWHSGHTVKCKEELLHKEARVRVFILVDGVDSVGAKEGESPGTSHFDSKVFDVAEQHFGIQVVRDVKVQKLGVEDGLFESLFDRAQNVDKVHIV